MSKEPVSNRRQLLMGAGMAAVVGQVALATPSRAANRKRKLIWVPQALGDWDTAFQVGVKEFCDLFGWSYQRIGNPDYSAENHLAEVNNAIAAKPDVILTELESPALAIAFREGLRQGITMVIVDQGIETEAKKLGLGIINEDGYNAGLVNGTAAATFAEKLTGKKDGFIVLGNGNPGAILIDQRQHGTEEGVKRYNLAHGTKYKFEAFPDSEFGDMTISIQKWTAQFTQKGNALVAAAGTGNPLPIVQAMQELGMKPGSIACGSTDTPPATQKAIQDGWVQWGIDEGLYLMGSYAATAAYDKIEGKYPYPTIRVGGNLVTIDNLKDVSAQTAIWVAKAKKYGFV
jgi:ABC-type sugar transport system substrate-binding protein